jgi:hypothetical protein
MVLLDLVDRQQDLLLLKDLLRQLRQMDLLVLVNLATLCL